MWAYCSGPGTKREWNAPVNISGHAQCVASIRYGHLCDTCPSLQKGGGKFGHSTAEPYMHVFVAQQ